MKYNKGFGAMGIILALAVVLVVGGLAYYAGKNSDSSKGTEETGYLPQVNQNTATSTSVVSNNSVSKTGTGSSHQLLGSSCGLTINSPAANAHVSFPLTVTGTIDNTNSSALGCSWTMFEGQAGTAQLYFFDQGNNNWHVLGNPIIVPVSNWMTVGPVSFTIPVNFNNSGLGLSSGNPMKITFTEENPSGATPDTFDLPLVLQ